MTSKQMLKLMISNGWKIKRTKGSHYIMEKGGEIEILPYHGTELKKGIESALLKRMGLN